MPVFGQRALYHETAVATNCNGLDPSANEEIPGKHYPGDKTND
jgi:hypothetical protein